MSEHTPGPWVIASGSHVCGRWTGMVRIEASEDFHSNGQDYPDGGSTKSYTNVVCGLSGHSETAIANANLIAAAPDLLAACKAVDELESDGYVIPKGHLAAFTAVRKAIAKAEGGAG